MQRSFNGGVCSEVTQIRCDGTKMGVSSMAQWVKTGILSAWSNSELEKRSVRMISFSLLAESQWKYTQSLGGPEGRDSLKLAIQVSCCGGVTRQALATSRSRS